MASTVINFSSETLIPVPQIVCKISERRSVPPPAGSFYKPEIFLLAKLPFGGTISSFLNF